MGHKEDNWRRGTIHCNECKWYGMSKLTFHYRCYHPDNIRDSYIGTIYIDAPDAHNWDNKCLRFKTNKNREEN
jgi:hypothetical protein